MIRTLGELSESELVEKRASAENRMCLLQAMKKRYEQCKRASQKSIQIYSMSVQSAKLEADVYDFLLKRIIN